MAISPILIALLVLRIVGPGILLLVVLSFSISSPSSHNHDHDHGDIAHVAILIFQKVPRRALIIFCLCLTAIAFFLDGVVVIAYALFTGAWQGSSQQWRLIEVADVLGLMAFTRLAALGTWKDFNGIRVWTCQRVKVFAISSLTIDVAQLVLISLSMYRPSDNPPESKLPFGHFNIPNSLHILLHILRVLSCAVVVTALYFPRISYVPAPHLVVREDVLTTPLVPSPKPASSRHQYGTFASTLGTPSTIRRTAVPEPAVCENFKPQTWSSVSCLGKFAPYLWPKKNKRLQILAVISIFLLVIGRLVNVLIPFTLGNIIYVFEQRSNSKPNLSVGSPWPSLIFCVMLHFLRSPGGLPTLRETLWAPTRQYSDREMSLLVFNHLLDLTLEFHTRRNTDDVLHILEHGATINRVLESLLFSVSPIFFDILIALVLFYCVFGWPLALTVLLATVVYVWASIVMTEWRMTILHKAKYRDIIRGIQIDFVSNYETVKCFNGGQYEALRYHNAFCEFQALEFNLILSLGLLGLVQNLIFSFGILTGSFLVVIQITSGKLSANGQHMSASDYIIFIAYIAQLYIPLNSLGDIYHSVSRNLVDAERVIKLLDEPTEVNDQPGAPDLRLAAGAIEFDNVSFSYDGYARVLNGISFKIPKQCSIVLLGESGSGKSTLLKLLYRFYDLKQGEGRILIDGQDIRSVTRHSLRAAIGLLPRDSVLFNSSIAHNISYGKWGATHEEIVYAAKAVQMHERIMSFPEGYETKVGEQSSIRLSEGEKRRVAMARILLKKPYILLLDEVASGLDTSTEKDVLNILKNMIKGRSVLTVTTRLSTITSADIILVLRDGQIVESGTFRELQAKNGIFTTMWADHVLGDGEPVKVSQESAICHNFVDSQVRPEDVQLQQSCAQPVTTAEVTSSETQDPFADPVSVDSSADLAPIAFPSSDSAPAALGFPFPSQPEIAISPAVTFGAEIVTLPLQGTPDRDAKPKRIRRTSQNVQKFARALSARRPSRDNGSSITTRSSRAPSVDISDGETNTDPRRGYDRKQAMGKGRRTKRGRDTSDEESGSDVSLTENGKKQAMGKGKKIRKRRGTQ